jgi:A/G-specific adenine glycosylase
MVKTRARHVETKSNVKKEQYDDTFKEGVVSLTTSSSECVTQNDNGEKKQSTLLWKWAHHDHSSFHDFETDEATQIRNALLHWYRAHRRKLPWRGDAPPYDGSTAGRTGKTTAQKKKNGNQSTIGKFFATKSQDPSTQLSNKKNSTNNNESQNMMSSTVMEVSAYGVWVSEIMLQQTRVEAVIPFYIKCEYS